MAGALGVDVVPLVMVGQIHDATKAVSAGLPSNWNPAVTAEGLVGVTAAGLLNRAGQRLMVKVKAKDFEAGAR